MIIEKERCCIVVFQLSAVFHIETVICFALQMMPGFYMENYTGRKWVEREYSLPKIFSLACKSSKPFGRLCLGRGSFEHHLSNSKGIRDIQDSMSTALDPGFHISFIMALYYKMRQMLLQNAAAILLQNETKVYYKMR